MQLARSDCRDAIDALALLHTRTFDEAESQAMAGMWLLALDILTPAELRAALAAYLKTPARFFPTPGALREIALQLRERSPYYTAAPAEPDEPVERMPAGEFRRLLAEHGVKPPTAKKMPAGDPDELP